MQENSLNILELFSIIKKRKVVFAYICIPAVIIAVVACLFMTKIYRAGAIISYSSHKGSSDSALDKLSNIFPSVDVLSERNPGEIIKLLKSRSMAEEVIRNNKLLPVFFEKKKSLFSSRTKEPTLWDGIRYIQNNLKVEYDRLSMTIEISFDFKDPKVAVNVVNEYIDTLNNRLKAETISNAKKAIESMEKQLIDVNDVLLKEKIYGMMVSQIGNIALAESQKYINFKLIDPPKAPDKKIKPNRRLIVIITFLGSFMISLFMILFLAHLERLKKIDESSTNKSL
jgi:uncharacterized protein involved in exopolysaccharide biosynthesis